MTEICTNTYTHTDRHPHRDGSMDRLTENGDIDRTRQDRAMQDQTRIQDKTRTDQNRPEQAGTQTDSDRFRQIQTGV